jgi:hypothetical protein
MGHLAPLHIGASSFSVPNVKIILAAAASAVDPNVGLHSLPAGGVRLVTRATITRLMGCTHSRGGVRLVTRATITRLMGCTHSRGGVRLVTRATKTRLMGCTHSRGGVRLVTRATKTRLMGCTHSRGVFGYRGVVVTRRHEARVASCDGGCTHSRGVCQIGDMDPTGSTGCSGCHQLNHVLTHDNNVVKSGANPTLRRTSW